MQTSAIDDIRKGRRIPTIKDIAPTISLDMCLITEAIHIGSSKTYFARQKVNIIIVDDEKMIRKAMKRIFIKQFKENYENIDLLLIEASDGIEGVLALYLSNLQDIKIDAVISDENMKFISGGYSSHIIEYGINNGFIQDFPMFIVTALGQNYNFEKYSRVVKKVYSKPIEKFSVLEIIKMILTNKS